MVSSHPTHNDHSMIIMILIINWIERCPNPASLLGLCVYFMVGQKPNGLFLYCRISWKLFQHRQLVVKLTLYLNLDQSLTFMGPGSAALPLCLDQRKISVSAAWVLLIAIPEAHIAYLNSYSSTAA